MSDQGTRSQWVSPGAAAGSWACRGTHLPLGALLLLKANLPAAVIRPFARDSSLRACSTAQECNLRPTVFLYCVSRGWLQLTLASLYSATVYSATALARQCFKVLLKTSADLSWVKNGLRIAVPCTLHRYIHFARVCYSVRATFKLWEDWAARQYLPAWLISTENSLEHPWCCLLGARLKQQVKAS